jgi:hypothetical protein
MFSNGPALTARPRSRPLRREFVTTICTEDLGRYAGVGLTLDEVIEEELRNIAVTPVAAVEQCDDLVIWEGNKVVALIRIGHDHRPIVTRFDPPAPQQAGPGTHEARFSGGDSSPRALALRVTRGAVADYLAMKRRAEEAHERYQEDIRDGPSLPQSDALKLQREQWMSLAKEAAIAAERHLFRCILALNGKVAGLPDVKDPGFPRPPCGVILDDRLYLALGGETGSTPIVVELNDVARLDTGEGGALSGKD